MTDYVDINQAYIKDLINKGSKSKIFKDLPKDVNELTTAEAQFLFNYVYNILKTLQDEPGR